MKVLKITPEIDKALYAICAAALRDKDMQIIETVIFIKNSIEEIEDREES